MVRVLKRIASFVEFSAWCCVGVAACVAIFITWEDRQPVMAGVYQLEGSKAIISDDSLLIELTGFKNLGHCKRVPFFDQGYSVVDGYKREVDFRFVDDESPLSSFDGGLLYIGPAEFSDPDIADATLLGLRVRHDCRGLEKVSPVYWISFDK